MKALWMYLKQLLIPLCHSFIILPVCAIFAGAPGEHALIAFWGMLMAFSLVGWLTNMLIPRGVNPWTVSAVLMLLGFACGMTFLPQLWCTISGFDGRDWLGLVLGIASGGVMVWTQQECHTGLADGMPNYELGIGMVLYIFTYFSYRVDGRYTNAAGEDIYQPIYLFGVIWLMLAMVVMNYQHINRMAATKNHPRPPKNVLAFNVILSLMLAGITLLFANFGLLRNLATRLFLMIMKFLFPMVAEELPEELPTEEAEPEDEESGPPEEWQLPMWVQVTFMAISGLVVLIVAVLLIRLVWSLREEKKRGPRGKEYEEEVESLLDWDGMKKKVRRRMAGKAGERFEDQPDARARVRWLYARLRDELRRREKYNSTLTPNEQMKKQYPAQERAYQLSELYNRARYSQEDISEDEALDGKEILEELKRKK